MPRQRSGRFRLSPATVGWEETAYAALEQICEPSATTPDIEYKPEIAIKIIGEADIIGGISADYRSNFGLLSLASEQ